MKSCITCGMPFEGDHTDDVGLELQEGSVCKFDAEGGMMKSAKEIFQGGVEYFSHHTDGDKNLAEKVTRKNMSQLEYWKKHPFAELNGEMATDQEFGAVMMKL